MTELKSDPNEILREDIMTEIEKWLCWHNDLTFSSCDLHEIRLYTWLKTLLDVIKEKDEEIRILKIYKEN